jgi:molybdopterin molybdotransferase
MISVQEATRIILSNATSYGVETLPLLQAAGCFLRQDLVADRDFPPFDRVAMDGIAICYEAFRAGRRVFPIEGLQAAGAPQLSLAGAHACLEVMTGAMLPAGTDTVIRYEDLEISKGQATMQVEDVQPGQNIHRQGSDRRQGETVVRAGCFVSPAEIGVAATIGQMHLRVAKLPRVAIISTGDELVGVEEMPLPHQIRRSNNYAIATALSRWGVGAPLLHLKDEKTDIETKLRHCLRHFDALLLSGGVSAGKLDFVPEVLDALGVEKLFHKVSQRPGKPFWFGKSPDGPVVFALPGNPVSSFVCTLRYFQPWLRQGLGLSAFEERYAVLMEDYFFKPNLTYFLQVKTEWRKDGSVVAVPVTGGGSGDLANLVDADAFLELPRDRQDFRAGEAFPLIPYR